MIFAAGYFQPLYFKIYQPCYYWLSLPNLPFKYFSMTKSLNAVNVFALVLGIYLTIEGVLGLFNPLLFGLFSTTLLHTIIHILLGVSGIYAGLRNHARNFCYFTGVLLLVVGLLFFVPVIEINPCMLSDVQLQHGMRLTLQAR